MQARLSHYLLLHFIVFIWGFTGILGKIISVKEDVLVWWRMLMVVVVLAGYMLVFHRDKFKITAKFWWITFGTGIVIALHWIFFYGAIKLANASVAAAMMAVASFFTAFLQPLFYKTKIVLYELVLSIGVIIGVSILMGVETGYMEGFIWGLISAFFSALFTVINGLLVKKADSVSITFYEMIGGFIGISIYILLIGKMTGDQLAISEHDMWYLLLLSVCCTAFPFVASVWLMKYVSPYTVSISVNLEPIYTFIMAILLWPEEEKMGPGFYLGSAIILLSVLANSWIKAGKRKLEI